MTDLSEAAINRLLANSRNESQAPEPRPLISLRSIIQLARTDPSVRFVEGENGREQIADWAEHRIAKCTTAWLSFIVDLQSGEPQHTSERLSDTKAVDLTLGVYDVAVPDDIAELRVRPFPETTTIRLAPLPGTDGRGQNNRSFGASFEGGSPLDVPDTKTVIGILALIEQEASLRRN